MHRVVRQKGVDGSAVVLGLVRRGEDGAYVDDASTYSASDPLACVVWPGGDLPVVATLPAEWVDAAAGEVRVSFPSTAWTGLDRGIYQAAVRLATTPPTDLAYLEIELTAGPAAGVARPTYISRDDLEEEFPNLEATLGHVDSDGTGFWKLRSDARDWIDLLILSHHRPDPTPNPFQFQIPWIPAQPETNRWLADLLAADALILTSPNGRRLVKAQVHWVLGRVFRRAANASAQAGNLLDLASYHELRASELVMTAVAELDADDDGKADVAISFRTTVTRRR